MDRSLKVPSVTQVAQSASFNRLAHLEPREFLTSAFAPSVLARALGVLVIVAMGCARGERDRERRVAEDAGRHDEELGTRADAVARADALAVSATHVSGDRAQRLVLEAAELREKLFRLEHREADGLEAVELFGQAVRVDPTRRCEPAVRQALLEAELKHDPALAYRRIDGERAQSSDARCRALCNEALVSLAAFRSDAVPPPSASAVSAVGSSAPNSGPVVVPSKSGTSAEPASVTEIERYGAKDAARVVVHVTHPTLFEVRSLPAEGVNGPRLVVDLANTTAHQPKALPVGGLVERVRVGAQVSGTRVVLDLAQPAYRRVFYLPEPFRLVIDVSKDPPVGFADSAVGERAVRRVVLDPGHGGNDPGAIGPGGLREKDVTLDIAHRAAPVLARELGISTLLTRDTDVYVALDERTARANAFAADLLISIHCNASEDGGGKGVMSFVLDGSRDALSARIAARENSASAAAASELANALSAVLDRSVVNRSERLAELLERATLASLSGRYPDVPDLGVRRAGFYVLAGATMPAVLFETSFISNPQGEERLGTPDYRQKLADGIVNAVRAYRDGR
ncbi:MAG TPA: N-acetylmuramoyl-L-alanine amidase [Polyangiaceae bacterium]|nr:N-acetylmuramoyl-L-alanine amidase [Polyangiaceae bacterium]